MLVSILSGGINPFKNSPNYYVVITFKLRSPENSCRNPLNETIAPIFKPFFA